MNTQERWSRRCLGFALLVSLVGFLGYYGAEGFVSFPPIVVLGLQVIAGSIGVVVLRENLLVNIRGVLPLIAVAAWAALTLIWADDPMTAMRRWLLVFVPGILICLLASMDLRPQRTFAWFIGIVVAIVVASGLFSAIVMAFWETTVPQNALRYFLLDVNGWTPGVAEGGRQFELGFYLPRFSGLTSNPNGVSLFAAIALIALCAFVKAKRGARHAWLLLFTVLIAFLLLLSGSRAAYAMAATGILFVVLLRMDRRQSVRLAVLLVCGLALALYLVTWLTGGAEDAGHAEILQLRERSYVWRIAMGALGEVWPTGFGFGLTEESVFAPLGFQTAAHSLSLTILLETGVVGLVLVLVAWFSPVLRTTQRDRNMTATEIAVIALLVGLFVHQAVDSSVFRYHWAHFVFVYLLGASAGLSGSRTNA